MTAPSRKRQDRPLIRLHWRTARLTQAYVGFNGVTRSHEFCYVLVLYIECRVNIAVMSSMTDGACAKKLTAG